jgi:hypothetical protein
MMKIDKYLEARGGTAHMINVNCAKCGKKILFYQKDGPGWLKRCYLNRIFGVEKWENLQHNLLLKNPADLPDLICDCGHIIGTPMIHKDGRLAFKLIRGSFKRRRSRKK